MASLKDVFGSPNYNNQDLIELELSKIIYCMFYAVVMLNDLTLKIFRPFMIAVSIIEIVLQSIDDKHDYHKLSIPGNILMSSYRYIKAYQKQQCFQFCLFSFTLQRTCNNLWYTFKRYCLSYNTKLALGKINMPTITRMLWWLVFNHAKE